MITLLQLLDEIADAIDRAPLGSGRSELEHWHASLQHAIAEMRVAHSEAGRSLKRIDNHLRLPKP